MLITPEVFISITRGIYRVVRNDTPMDAKVLAAGYDEKQRALFVDMESAAYSTEGDDGIADAPVIERLLC
jgi:hypothetical protein